MTACAAELQSQTIWLHTARVNNRDRRRPKKRSDAGERKGKQMNGCGWGLGVCVDWLYLFLSGPPTITISDTESILKSLPQLWTHVPREAAFRQRSWSGGGELFDRRACLFAATRAKQKEKGGSAGATVLISCFFSFLVLLFFSFPVMSSWLQVGKLDAVLPPTAKALAPTWTRRQKRQTKAGVLSHPHLFILHIPQSSCQAGAPRTCPPNNLKERKWVFFGGVERGWRVYSEPTFSDSTLSKKKGRKKNILFSSLQWS